MTTATQLASRLDAQSRLPGLLAELRDIRHTPGHPADSTRSPERR